MSFGTSEIKELSIEEILSKVSDYDIFKHYIPNFERVGQKFCSHLRVDNDPSCGIFEADGKLLYKDLSTGFCGDCFKYVRTLFECSFKQSLCIISNDFGLDLCDEKLSLTRDMIGILTKKEDRDISNSEIRVKRRQWTLRHILYWQQYGIMSGLLAEYKVFPIECYWIGNQLISIPKDELAFCYHFGEYNYKIYRPHNEEFKWTSTKNCPLQGYAQLPKNGDLLFITSSLKDIMCLRALGYNAVAPSTESSKVGESLLNELKIRFKRVLLYYNNDGAGISNAIKFSKRYEVPYVHHNIGEPKDPSDYYKVYEKDNTKKMIEILIENAFKGSKSKDT